MTSSRAFVKPSVPNASVRLQKALADAGIAARRDCELLILKGRVHVNGREVRALPCFVDPKNDVVTFDGVPVDISGGWSEATSDKGMHMKATNLRCSRWLLSATACTTLILAAMAGQPADAAGKAWKPAALEKALANPSRPQADRDRDADRKPAQLMTFFGVEPGMTAVDVIAAGGYMTDVLAVAVGPKGKVYSQNPPVLLQMREGIYNKEITERLAKNRLPNVVRVDADLRATAEIPAGSVDVAVTAMNFHDVYNRDPAQGQAFMKAIFTMLKPGGVFGVTDHVGEDGADNAKLHRIPKHIAVESAKAAGFVVEAESDVLAHSGDDHTKMVFDPGLRGKTDQFTLRLRKPK